MFAQLGEIRFELVPALEGMEGTLPYAYAEHAVIQGKPRLQWMGAGLEELRLAFRFHRAFADPAAELARLQAAAAAHAALAFVMGDGTYRGRYVITELGTAVQQADAGGAPLALTVAVTLREWVEAPGQPAKRTGATPGVTRSTRQPVARRAAPVPPPPGDKTSVPSSTITRQPGPTP